MFQNCQWCQSQLSAVHLGWLRRTPWRNRRSACPREKCVIKTVKKLGSLCRCEDPKSVGGGRVSEAGLEPLSCEKEVGLQGTPEDGHGAEASGQICL